MAVRKDDLLDHAVGEILLLGVAAHICKRQYRDRRLVRQRKRHFCRIIFKADRGRATLLDAVNFYDVRFGLGLTNSQKADLVAFLRSL